MNKILTSKKNNMPTIQTIRPNTRVVYYNRYPNYFTYPITSNSCQLQVEALEDNLVAKIRATEANGDSASKLASLKADADAIANQKASCNSFLGTTVVSPVTTYPVYRTY